VNLVVRNLSIGLLAATLLLAGCAADKEGISTPTDRADRTVGHIDGLGVDPADGTLYVATHHGLFHVDEAGDALRVADRWQDTMAFTVVGPRRFLASGHPDLRDDLPPHLGLIQSTDAGETWRPLALQGEADFHILEQFGDSLYAYDATSGRLLVTRDREWFEEVATLPLVSITAHSEGSSSLLGTTNEGRLLEIDVSTGAASELRAPTLVLLDTTLEGDIVGIDPAGVVQVSEDSGQTWQRRGEIGGQPAAFSVTNEDWYAATTDQVFRSDDDGATWTRVL